MIDRIGDGRSGRDHQSAYDAVVPAGGGARRLGGVDKPMLDIAGTSLLDRVLEACSGAAATVVVGPPRRVGRQVLWTAEQPPGGGPVAALAAGLAALDHTSQGSVPTVLAGAEREAGQEAIPRGSAPWVGVFAADLPFLAHQTVHRLWKTAVESAASDGAVLTDDTGHEQWLVAMYRRTALDQALDTLGRDRLVGASLRALLRGLRLERVPAGPSSESMDCDTWDDVAAARRLADTRDRERKDT